MLSEERPWADERGSLSKGKVRIEKRKCPEERKRGLDEGKKSIIVSLCYGRTWR